MKKKFQIINLLKLCFIIVNFLLIFSESINSQQFYNPLNKNQKKEYIIYDLEDDLELDKYIEYHGDYKIEALKDAIKEGNIDNFKLFYNGSNSLEAKDSEGFNLFLWLKYGPNRKIIRYLANNDVDISNDVDNNQYLLFFSKIGNIDGVEVQIKKGININNTIDKGITALMFASEEGYIDVVKLLIEKGADINKRDSSGRTALIRAVRKRHPEIVKYLIEHGAKYDENNFIEFSSCGLIDYCKEMINKGVDVNLKKNNSETALTEAAYFGNLDMVKFLIEKGADINLRGFDSCTALMIAAKKGYYEIVKYLIEKKADVNIRNRNGETSLIIAIRRKYPKSYKDNKQKNMKWFFKYEVSQIVKLFLEKGIGTEINSNNKKNATALLFAVYKGYDEIAKLLIDNGADINFNTKIDDYNITALDIAFRKRFYDLAYYLIEKGAIYKYETALYYSMIEGNYEKSKYFIEKGADISKLQEPLLTAAKGGNIDVIKLIVEKGATIGKESNIINDYKKYVFKYIQVGLYNIVKQVIENGFDVKEFSVNEGYNNNITPLMIAAEYGHIEIVKLLIEKGAEYDKSFLTFFCAGGLLKYVKELIEKGADVNSTSNYDIRNDYNYKSFSPLMCAAKNGHIDILKYLIKNGANINYKNNSGETALFVGSEKGYLEIIDLLIEKGADINNKNNYSWTSLMIAAYRGDLETTKYLISKGTDEKLNDENGYTALNLAAEKGHFDIVKLLIEKGADPKGSWIFAFDNGKFELAKFLLEYENDYSRNLKLAVENSNCSNLNFNIRMSLGIGFDDSIPPDFFSGYQKPYRDEIIEIIKYFIDKGAEINSKYCKGENYRLNNEHLEQGDSILWSPLMFASFDNNLVILKILIEKGADVNAKDSRGKTALMIACDRNNLEIVKLLIEKGADINAKSNDDMTALKYAKVYNYKEIIDYLNSKGAKE